MIECYLNMINVIGIYIIFYWNMTYFIGISYILLEYDKFYWNMIDFIGI